MSLQLPSMPVCYHLEQDPTLTMPSYTLIYHSPYSLTCHLNHYLTRLILATVTCGQWISRQLPNISRWYMMDFMQRTFTTDLPSLSPIATELANALQMMNTFSTKLTKPSQRFYCAPKLNAKRLKDMPGPHSLPMLDILSLLPNGIYPLFSMDGYKSALWIVHMPLLLLRNNSRKHMLSYVCKNKTL